MGAMSIPLGQLKETLTFFGVLTWQKRIRPKDVGELIDALSANRDVIVRGLTDVECRKRDTQDVVDSLMRRVGGETDLSPHRSAA